MSTDSIRGIPVADDQTDGWGDADAEQLEEGDDLGHPSGIESPRDASSDQPRRDNWYGEGADSEDEQDSDSDGGVAYSASTRRQDKAQHVAVDMLAGVVPALCGETWSDGERVAEELTQPGYYPVGDGFMDHVENARVNETDGYISQGESTWVLYHGSKTAEFIFIIEVWLDYAVDNGVIGRDLADDLLSDAKSMKQGTDKPDQRIVEILAVDVQKAERSVRVTEASED